MHIITLRVAVAILAFVIGIAVNHVVNRSSLIETSLTYVMKSSGILSLDKNAERDPKTTPCTDNDL
ncbi:MAG TPA: hypothetical protein VIG25_12570 [Pyrinomonadaceae bacterium]